MSGDNSGDVVVAAGSDAAGWCADHRQLIDDALLTRGWLVLRDAGADTPGAVAAARDALELAAVPSIDEFAGREQFGNGVLSAPEWAADREMCLHHERSYSAQLPAIVLVGCALAPRRGGELLLSDTAVTARVLPPQLVSRVAEQGWVLRRTFRSFLGINWPAVFGTDDPGVVDAWARKNVMTTCWQRDGSLHTVQRRPGIISHPRTGTTLWFNQIAFFSSWSVPDAERAVLQSSFGANGLPFVSSFGDGSEPTEAEFNAVLDAYDDALTEVSMNPGDLLILDNLRTAHGRRPHQGDRRMLVAPADPVLIRDLSAGPLDDARELA